jgi:hypothetical protein
VSLRRITAIATLLALALAGETKADETLVLRDGRRLAVTRLARRGGKVRIQTKDGKVFEVPEDQVVSPALDSIPGSAPAAAPPSAPATQDRQVVQLRDGRSITVTRLARRGGRVRIETTDGRVFEIAESEVISPPLASIPTLAPPVPPAASSQAAPPGLPPPAPGPAAAPPLPIATVSPVPPTPQQPGAGTQLSNLEFVP